MTGSQTKDSADLGDIDSGWDDEGEPNAAPESSVSAIPDPLNAGDRITAIPELDLGEFARRAMVEAEEEEQKSGVQAREPVPSGSSPLASVELDLPPLVTPDLPPGEHVELTVDDPGSVGRASYDDLSLDLDTSAAPDPMQLGAAPTPFAAELDLETPAVPPAGDPTLVELRDRYAAGDFTGALALAEGLLEADPEHPDGKRYANSCREVLMQMYSARLGSLDQVVRVAIPADQVRWLSLDHRAGFLLSLVDGTSTVEELLDISGMVRLDALRILHTLVEQEVVALGDSTPR